MRILKRLVFLLVVAGLVGLGVWWFYGAGRAGPGTVPDGGGGEGGTGGDDRGDGDGGAGKR